MNARRLIAATFAGALALTFAATDVAAKEGRGHGPSHAAARHDRREIARNRSFAIPHRIATRDFRDYRSYRVRGWTAPGHRSYVVYRFPVVTRVGVVFQDFTYCDGVLVGAPTAVIRTGRAPRYGYDDLYYRWDDRVGGYVEFRGPRVSIGIGF